MASDELLKYRYGSLMARAEHALEIRMHFGLTRIAEPAVFQQLSDGIRNRSSGPRLQERLIRA
jgi:hypothetical protein